MKEDIKRVIEKDCICNNCKKHRKYSLNKKKKAMTCKCGIVHTGHYGKKCAVCVVMERAGINESLLAELMENLSVAAAQAA